VLGVLGAIGLLISVALVVPVTAASSLAGAGGVLTAVARVSAMSGTFLLLVTLLLIARIPAVERAIGQDRLVKLHRTLGPAIIGLLGVHVVSVVLAYAAQVATGPWHELIVLTTTFPGMLPAVVGFGLLVVAAFTSYGYVRRKMKYETWWAVHLYTYLAVALSLPHQILTGAPFLGHPLAMAWWLTLWFATAGAVIVYRWGLPIARSLKHKVTVHSVEQEAPGVVSVTMSGRRLDRLGALGGQFLHWRFLKKGLWWQAHPYSLSAVPTATRMRITVKDLGDHSGALAEIEPGTRVAIEGPYGAFTHRARHTDQVVLIAAGVGVTPVRALLEDLPRHVDVVAILRGRSRRDLVLRDELAHLVGERGGQLHELLGPRSAAKLDARGLVELVPDIAARDLYVCGPSGFMQSVIAAARRAGVRGERIHHEDFASQATERRTRPTEGRPVMRSALVIATTAAGLAALLSFRPHSAATGGSQTAAAAALTTGRAHVAGAQTVVGSVQQLNGGLGNIQVKVTAANGKITSVGMAQMNLHGPQSQQISSHVIPQLEQQVLASNGGPIHAVSGATYTSQAFGRSLQAALGQLKGGANAQLAAAGHGNGGLVQSQGGEHDD
jgi:predicted ferric reductase/uncharacterized protein with FMN-binding domain